MENSTVLWILALLAGFFFAKRINTQSKQENMQRLTPAKQKIASEIIETEFISTERTTKINTGEKIDKEGDENSESEEDDDKIKPTVRTKRVVTRDMIEIVQTLAPHLHEDQIKFSLEKTGSIELTINDFMEGKDFPFPKEEDDTAVKATNNDKKSEKK